WAKPPVGSSSAAPGACTTPSRLIHSVTITLRILVSFWSLVCSDGFRWGGVAGLAVSLGGPADTSCASRMPYAVGTSGTQRSATVTPTEPARWPSTPDLASGGGRNCVEPKRYATGSASGVGQQMGSNRPP